MYVYTTRTDFLHCGTNGQGAEFWCIEAGQFAVETSDGSSGDADNDCSLELCVCVCADEELKLAGAEK